MKFSPFLMSVRALVDGWTEQKIAEAGGKEKA